MLPDGIRTHNLSRRAAADLRLRPLGHWDRQLTLFSLHYLGLLPYQAAVITSGGNLLTNRVILERIRKTSRWEQKAIIPGVYFIAHHSYTN